MTLLSLSAALLVSVLAAAMWRRHVVRSRVIARQHQENRARQDLLIGMLDSIKKIAENRELSPAEVEQRTVDIFAAMESLNEEDSLTPLIEDTKGYLKEELAKRRAS